MRRLGAPKPTREPKTSARPKEAGQASPRKEGEEIHTRAPELQVKKKSSEPPMYVSFFPAYANIWITETVGGATLARWSEEKGA